ncbi:MAG TPA: hypothetical protein P5556_07645 [Candidatus Gastranaerophilales bacterium]|nr:hypothetical protein [Candidatus Gastranaerophilales bacterium]
METTPKNKFKSLIKEIFNLPVWIKQIIYLELKKEFETAEIKSFFDLTTKDNCFQLYRPKLTYAGRKETEKKTGKYQEEVYNLLEGAFQELSIIEIAIANQWNLYECAKHFLNAIDQDLIVKPTSTFIKGTALYMGGRIRLGEYFVKIDKINMEQLDEALRNQKHLEDSLGDRPGLAEILINLGFLTKHDTEGILFLKKDCKKYFNPENSDLKN